MRVKQRTASKRMLGVMLAFGLAAAACSSDGGDDAVSTDGTEPSASTDDTDVTTDTSTDDTEEDPATTDANEEPATSEAEADPDPVTTEAEEPATDGAMTPVRGGTVVSLLEAETDSWSPNGSCAASCIQVMQAVADPLTIINEDGEIEPFLLESFEANDDFTEYTLTMREGVTFHDGTPADGAALQRSLVERANSLIASQVLADLAGGAEGIVLVDEMTVTVTFAVPDATFPRWMSERNGWLLAPAYFDDPDVALAIPIGTGPFVMTEWTRDERTLVEANPDYWRTDGAGESLPYLDSIEFRPVPDPASRRAIMEAGDADVNMDSTAENVAFWRDEWEGNDVLAATPRETSYLLLNTGAPPFDNPDLRRALALCTDRQLHLELRAPDSQLANGPFAEGDLGYLEDTGFPEFDAEAGNALFDEIGRPDVINYQAAASGTGLLTAELFAKMWSDNCGLTVNIDQFDQSTGITNAITGNFEMILWRNHGQGHPGMELVWWHSRHAVGLALNFGRIVDPDLDALLVKSKTTDDPAELDELTQQMNLLFGENVYNIWLNTAEWFFPHQSNVHGVGTMNLESGNVGQAPLAGRLWLQEAWKDG